MNLLNSSESTENVGSELPSFRSMAVPIRQEADAMVVREFAGGSAKQRPGEAAFHDRIREHDTKATATISAAPTLHQPATWAPISQLRRLSYYHPLEQTHATIPAAQLEHALTRVTEAFRDLSLQVCYETNSLSAACLSMEQVEFQVSFYEDRGDGQKVILEVQRLAGDAYTFYRCYASALLALIRSNDIPRLRKEMPRLSSKSLDRLASISGLPKDDPMELVESALECACNMITSDRVDACRLGLESLVILTDPCRTGWKSAQAAACALGTTPGNANSPRAEKIASILWHLLWTPAVEDTNVLALQIWGQTWNVLAEDSSKGSNAPDACLNLSMEQAEKVAQALMHQINAAQEAPHQATLALHSMQALAKLMPSLKDVIEWPTVEKAYTVGCAQHAALERASHQLLTIHV